MAIERAFASASFALDAASYTQVGGMTLTPGAGDFIAFFSMDVTFVDPAGFEDLFAAIFVNGVILAESERAIESENSLDGVQTLILSGGIVSPTGGQVVEIRYFSTTTGEFTGFNRELTLFPAAVSVEASATGDDTIAGGGAATLGSMSLMPPAGDHLLLFTTSAEGVASNVIEFRVTIGGVVVPHTARLLENESSSPNISTCIMIAASINVDGAELVEIEWERVAGGGTSTAHERTMSLVETEAADIFQASGTADDTATSTSDELVDDMTITDPGARDYLALFSSSDFYGANPTDAKTTYTIYEDGSAVAGIDRTLEHEDSIDNTDIPVFSGGRVSVSSGTSDVQVFWRSNVTTTRTLHERTLVIIREPLTPVSQTFLGNHEALGVVEQTVVVNHEALAGVLQTVDGNHEAEGFLAANVVVNHEARGVLEAQAIVNHEALGDVVQTVVVNHESDEQPAQGTGFFGGKFFIGGPD